MCKFFHGKRLRELAGNTWKTQVLERMAEAGGRFDSARWWIIDVVSRLASPMQHAADAGSARHGIRLVHGALAGVSDELALAASAMAAAELVAVSPIDPLPPLSAVHGVPGREHSMTLIRRALGALRSARGLAEDAHGSVERCRGHLCAALHLLDHPSLGRPALDGFLEAERVAAHRVLEDAQAAAVESEMLLIAARQYVRNAHGVN